MSPTARPSRRRAPLALTVVLAVVLAGMLTLAACGTPSSSATATQTVPSAPLIATDGAGRAISIPASAPQRIISLEPSNSEILAALNVTARVVAVDYYTDYPAEMAAKPKVTDTTFTANVEQIVALKPDLVLDYQGFYPDADKQLTQAGIDVLVMPAPTRLEPGSNPDEAKNPDVLTEIRLVGQLVHAYPAANIVVAGLQARIDAVKHKAATAAPVSVYMEQDDTTPGKPYTFGGGSYANEMLGDAGGANIFASNTENGGYPQVSDEAVIAANPEVIILDEDGVTPNSVGSRPGYAGLAAVQNHRIYAVDQNLFSRAGPRLVDGLEQLAKDIHPELFT